MYITELNLQHSKFPTIPHWFSFVRESMIDSYCAKHTPESVPPIAVPNSEAQKA
jgi:hypothetical protein